MVEVAALTKAMLIMVFAFFLFCRSYCCARLINSLMLPSSSALAHFETHKGWFLTEGEGVGTSCTHMCHVMRHPGGISEMEYDQNVWD